MDTWMKAFQYALRVGIITVKEEAQSYYIWLEALRNSFDKFQEFFWKVYNTEWESWRQDISYHIQLVFLQLVKRNTSRL